MIRFTYLSADSDHVRRARVQVTFAPQLVDVRRLQCGLVMERLAVEVGWSRG